VVPPLSATNAGYDPKKHLNVNQALKGELFTPVKAGRP